MAGVSGGSSAATACCVELALARQLAARSRGRPAAPRRRSGTSRSPTRARCSWPATGRRTARLIAGRSAREGEHPARGAGGALLVVAGVAARAHDAGRLGDPEPAAGHAAGACACPTRRHVPRAVDVQVVVHRPQPRAARAGGRGSAAASAPGGSSRARRRRRRCSAGRRAASRCRSRRPSSGGGSVGCDEWFGLVPGVEVADLRIARPEGAEAAQVGAVRGQPPALAAVAG